MKQLIRADTSAAKAARGINENGTIGSPGAAGYLSANPPATLAQTLEAALGPRVIRRSDERFTVGAWQAFLVTSAAKIMAASTLRESTARVYHLPFVRLMRDILRYAITSRLKGSMNVMRETTIRHDQNLSGRFATRKGKTFLLALLAKSRADRGARLGCVLDGLRPTATRLAAVHSLLCTRRR